MSSSKISTSLANEHLMKPSFFVKTVRLDNETKRFIVGDLRPLDTMDNTVENDPEDKTFNLLLADLREIAKSVYFINTDVTRVWIQSRCMDEIEFFAEVGEYPARLRGSTQGDPRSVKASSHPEAIRMLNEQLSDRIFKLPTTQFDRYAVRIEKPDSRIMVNETLSLNHPESDWVTKSWIKMSEYDLDGTSSGQIDRQSDMLNPTPLGNSYTVAIARHLFLEHGKRLKKLGHILKGGAPKTYLVEGELRDGKWTVSVTPLTQKKGKELPEPGQSIKVGPGSDDLIGALSALAKLVVGKDGK
ncbi:hypothetical protein CC80DRAFT_506125 [Byssothecium circinans]|uniref:Uncharacterized protein n=1 Tax=Byssothecium circinans TaxID=147558 RepID=A0A6A5TSD1_9PLEO|nr:hypothetical protein CC80DRAFT_506125 [Byssothecium circinans]